MSEKEDVARQIHAAMFGAGLGITPQQQMRAFEAAIRYMNLSVKIELSQPESNGRRWWVPKGEDAETMQRFTDAIRSRAGLIGDAAQEVRIIAECLDEFRKQKAGGVGIPAKVRLREDMPRDPYPYTERHHYEWYTDILVEERKAVLTAKVVTVSKRLVYVITILKEVYGEDGHCSRGGMWQFCKNHPKLFGYNGWHYFDLSQWKKYDETTSLIGEMYIVAEVDPDLVEKKADKRELNKIADWAITYINQERRKRQGP